MFFGDDTIENIMDADILKQLIQKIPFSDTIKSALPIEKLESIVSGGLVQLKSAGVLDMSQFGLDDKVPQVQDLIAMAGKFAAVLAPLKLGGGDKQTVVLELVNVLLVYLVAIKPALKEKIAPVQRAARETLPAVLTLAVNAARGDLSAELRRKPGQSMTEYGRELGRKLLGFVRMLAPSFAICGLSSAAVEAVIEKGELPQKVKQALPQDQSDAIVGKERRPARADSEAPAPETPHHNTPRGSVDGPETTKEQGPEVSPQTVPLEIPGTTEHQEVAHDKEHEIQKASPPSAGPEAKSILYSA